MKCDKCGNEGSRRGEWMMFDGVMHCSECSKDKTITLPPTAMTQAFYDADFRAFRRQVLLALMSSDTSTTFMASEDYIKTAWDFADRIARAEPKE